jgi:endonuclease/exonuclease/phosphatase family metal-dependent hydrolase
MKIVSYNIQYAKGKDGRHDLARIADSVRGADLIGLQEVTRGFPGVPAALTDQPERLAQLLPEYFWTYAAPVDLDAGSSMVGGCAVSRRVQFGNMLLSRWPIRSTRHLLLPRSRSFDHGDAQNGVLEGIVAAPGGDVRIYVTHLDYLRSQQRRAQLDWLLPTLHAVPAQGASITGTSHWVELPQAEVPQDFVLMGDFNLAPQHAEYARIVGEPDYFYGRQRTGGFLVDSWVAAGHGEDEGLTWFDEASQFKDGLRLDYIFVTPALAGRVKGAWIDADNPASDHQPVGVEMDW